MFAYTYLVVWFCPFLSFNFPFWQGNAAIHDIRLTAIEYFHLTSFYKILIKAFSRSMVVVTLGARVSPVMTRTAQYVMRSQHASFSSSLHLAVLYML